MGEPPRPAEPKPATPSWFGRVGETYDMLWKMVIRPPRDLYSTEELGPSRFRLGRRVYERRDLQLQSSRGVLQCSHFIPAKFPDAKRPCVVYLHGNCSSRLEAFDALPVLLPRDLTVFCLDLSGSGRSEGEYISLGFHEEKDLRVVLQHLRSMGSVASIGLWGRSMGATTSILRAAEDQHLAASVLDSAFCDLKTVAEELVSRGRIYVPSFLVNMALEMMRSEVTTRAAFDPTELAPIKCAPKAVCPAFFGVAADDSFVLPHHTQDLHDAWAGEKTMRVFDGGHNGVRPGWFLEEAADFLAEKLRKAAGFRSSARTSLGLDEEGDEEAGGDNAENRRSTPRLLASSSGVTEGGDENAGKAGGESSKADRPRKKYVMANELTKMGFTASAVSQAVQRCSTLEEAVEWLLKQPGNTLGGVETGPPLGQRHLRPGGAADGNNASTSSSKLRPPSRPAPPLRRVKPTTNGSIVDHLQYLGFGEVECEEASHRFLKLEDAVQWLATQKASVQL